MSQSKSPKTQFVDYYELLQCSPNATLDSIERLFRHLVKQFHPDTAESGDSKKFTEVVEAFEVLRDSDRRDSYHKEYLRRKSSAVEAGTARSEFKDNGLGDTQERLMLLNILSERRRNNGKQPGMPSSSLATLSKLGEVAIDFHVWYFLQKGWVQREDSGVLSITAEGIDRIDEINISLSANGRARIES